MVTDRFIPPEIHEAIAAFLNECQNEARPLATVQALGAVRAIFPNLAIPDEHLKDAIFSEAAAAGFDVKGGESIFVNRKALECWDNEVGQLQARDNDSALAAPSFAPAEAPMDAITSLSIYREALICAIWTLDAFPVELRAFADTGRRLLESAVKLVEADIRYHRDADRSIGPTFLIFSDTTVGG